MPPLEIIVVVDSNPALYASILQDLDDIQVVENDRERGLGGARNTGVAHAQGDIVAFLDDDARASRGWIQALISAYASDQAVLGVGGVIEASMQDGRPRWFPSEFDWVVGCTYRGMPLQQAKVRNLMGCNMSFRREVFDRIGGFRLGYGCDETEFCIRVGREWPGGSLLHDPAAVVHHQVPRHRLSWRYFLSRSYFEGGSKAVVAWLLGEGEGLSSERTYTLKVLPRGIARNLVEVRIRRDIHGLSRAAAIIAGFASTTAGFIVGRLTTSRAARRRGFVAPIIPST